jgi:RhoGAP domain.
LCSAVIFLLVCVIAAGKVRLMKMSFDACCLTSPLALEYRDPHVIAGALKLYLRDLPEPLMTHALYDEWMAAARWGMP